MVLTTGLKFTGIEILQVHVFEYKVRYNEIVGAPTSRHANERVYKNWMQWSELLGKENELTDEQIRKFVATPCQAPP